MITVFLWIFGAFFVAFVFGVARTIGFWGSFLLSLILSPLIGLIITLFFDTIENDRRKKEQLQLQRQQVEILKNQKPTANVTEELEKLAKLKNDGMISDIEYALAKKKLLEK